MVNAAGLEVCNWLGPSYRGFKIVSLGGKGHFCCSTLPDDLCVAQQEAEMLLQGSNDLLVFGIHAFCGYDASHEAACAHGVALALHAYIEQRRVIMPGHHRSLHQQLVARVYESLELHFFYHQQNGKQPILGGDFDQSTTGLCHGLDLQGTRKDRKTHEMLLKVIFRHCHVFDCGDAVVPLKAADFVYKLIAHRDEESPDWSPL